MVQRFQSGKVLIADPLAYRLARMNQKSSCRTSFVASLHHVGKVLNIYFDIENR